MCDVVKERTIEDVVADYMKAREDTEMMKQPGYERVYIFKNQELRNKLREEYISLLPVEKRLACEFVKYTHEDNRILFNYYELNNGIEDNWEVYAHKLFLEKSIALLNILKGYVPEENLYEVACKIISTVGRF